jgi:hypothetical protein
MDRAVAGLTKELLDLAAPEEPQAEPRLRRIRDYRPDSEYDHGFGMGKPTLTIGPVSVRVHHVRAVQFETTDYPVSRHRWGKHEPAF